MSVVVSSRVYKTDSEAGSSDAREPGSDQVDDAKDREQAKYCSKGASVVSWLLTGQETVVFGNTQCSIAIRARWPISRGRVFEIKTRQVVKRCPHVNRANHAIYARPRRLQASTDVAFS